MRAERNIEYLLSHPEEMLKVTPYVRGSEAVVRDSVQQTIGIGEQIRAELPQVQKRVISMDRLLAEFDPACHDVLFDDNIPSITAKLADEHYVEIKFKKMALPLQRMIAHKHTLFLCGYDLQHTLDNENPTEQMIRDYTLFKTLWKARNMGGRRTKMVLAQKSTSIGGLLFYFDRHSQLKARPISYADGFRICSHDDENGDRLMECVYHQEGDNQVIDVFTDLYQYRYIQGNDGWSVDPQVNGIRHGFSEIPLVTKHGRVAWDGVQDIIEVYEIIYNIFLVIQKRHGWGILYIKGNFNENTRKIAGSVILNDASLSRDGDARFLTPPTPDGMIETLRLMEESIQKGSGMTIILPKDINTGGDISGVAIQVTQSLDNEEALAGVIEWQSAASKMGRLFKEGIAMELARNGDPEAPARFAQLDISTSFKQWRPRSDNEYNTMLSLLKGAGMISTKTSIEKNTESTPDEELRISKELDDIAKDIQLQESSSTRDSTIP